MKMKVQIHSNGIMFGDFDWLDESGNVGSLTQEQVDEMLKEHSRSVEQWAKEICSHSWEKYTGFTHEYYHCVYCGCKQQGWLNK